MAEKAEIYFKVTKADWFIGKTLFVTQTGFLHDSVLGYGTVPFRCRRLLSCGKGVKPPRACGVLPLLLFRWSQAPFAAIHSLVGDWVRFHFSAQLSEPLGLSGRQSPLPKPVSFMIVCFGMGPFLFAADACFPVGRELSLLVPAGSHHPPIPQESSAFRFNPLFGSGLGIKEP